MYAPTERYCGHAFYNSGFAPQLASSNLKVQLRRQLPAIEESCDDCNGVHVDAHPMRLREGTIKLPHPNADTAQKRSNDCPRKRTRKMRFRKIVKSECGKA